MKDVKELARTYERDGCVRVRGLLPLELLETVRAELDRYVRDVVPRVPEGDRTFESDGKTIRNLWRMEAHDRARDESLACCLVA